MTEAGYRGLADAYDKIIREQMEKTLNPPFRTYNSGGAYTYTSPNYTIEYPPTAFSFKQTWPPPQEAPMYKTQTVAVIDGYIGQIAIAATGKIVWQSKSYKTAAKAAKVVTKRVEDKIAQIVA